MGWFGSFPLLALPVLIFNVLAFTAAGGVHGAGAAAQAAEVLFVVPMTAGGRWPVSFGDLLIFVSLVILFIELLKSTTSRRVAIVNHSLSMILFIGCLVEFLLFQAFQVSSFFILTAMVLLDVLAGFIVTIASARRDVDIVR